MPHSETTHELISKIIEYRNRASVTRRSQYLASAQSAQYNMCLGIPVVLITALVGTAIFGTLQENPNIYIRIVAGIFSISATILAALQTYLGFSEKAQKHKEAGAKYATVWRAFDILATELHNKGDVFADSAISQLKLIVVKLDELGEKSPSVPDGAYQIAVKELRNKIDRAKNSDQLVTSPGELQDQRSEEP